MNAETSFRIGYSKAKSLLKKVDMLLEENTTRGVPPNVSFSKEFIQVSREQNYSQIYTTARRNRDYQILLSDESFFQFSLNLASDGKSAVARYAYYETPFDLAEVRALDNLHFGISTNWWETELLEDQLRSNLEEKRFFTPIRYDFDLGLFKAELHPASHLHIGFANEIRIPVSKVLSPLAFTCFVLRHIYRPIWKDNRHLNEVTQAYNDIKSTCIDLEQSYFPDIEKRDLYLH